MGLFISFDSFDIRHFVEPCKMPCSMQHVVSTPSTYPGSCKTCFSRKPVLIGQYALWSLPTAVLDDLFSSLGGYFEIISHSWLLNFIETRRASFDPFDITLKSISHSKTSFLDWSNKGQIWAIRLRRVWVTWHPSIWQWSLWIGWSTCSCEPTVSKTEPANAKGIVQAHVLQALKTFFRSKFTQAGSLG